MSEILKFLNMHQAEITVIATIFIAVSAIITAVATKTLARENKLLRKAETEPKVVAYLTLDPIYWGCFNFVLANVGRGPARNISFKFDADHQEFKNHDVALKNSADREAISFLPQGESISVFFGSSIDLYKDPRLKPFDVIIKYDDMSDKHRCERCRIDVAQFEGFTSLGKPPEQEAADSLKKIEGHLKQIASALKK